MQRSMTLVLALLLLVFAGCTGKKPSSTAEPTSEPTDTPSAQSTGDFQLVGRAQHAFVGIGPGIDLSTASTSDLSATETPGVSATPAASGTFGTPNQAGVMRVVLDDASDSLKSNCSAQRDGRINVFWTTSTQFDENLLTDDLESALEGRTVGVVGRIYTASDSSLNETTATASPSESASATESPSATPNPSCILVADQIGTSSGAIPTPFVRRTARTAAPVATASPTPAPTASATPVATTTASPVATTTVSPSTTP